MKYYAGLNFDETSIKCSIVARDGTLLCRDKVVGSKSIDAEEVVGQINHMVSMLKQRANVVLSGVGIVLPEIVAYLYGADDCKAVRLAEEMQTVLHTPVLLIEDFNVNDFDASAFGGL
jgi:predicted NBD/HSP70 family sugar kinase